MIARYVPEIQLNDGSSMPAIGLGTWKLAGESATRVVRDAINFGYRHIDTAAFYGNEREIGIAIAQAIAAGDVTREELFITSKVWQDHQGFDLAQQSFQDSLQRLGIEYLDCYMVHWPWPQQGRYVETFEALVHLQGLGQLRSVAVANFNEQQLRDVHAATGVVPAINQVELHPGFSQSELRKAHESLGVVTEAWAPLARGDVLDKDVVVTLAEHFGKTPAQIVLQWMYQQGISVIPKASQQHHLAENIDIYDFELSPIDSAAIVALDQQPGSGRLYADPEVFPG
ncbi:aldo/keto reductase [Corynebacterium sp. HS2168-gen11]|uniref:aldo/keto reductase n=1 Tax=Corynebacterium sp. HS2168-gen11 TaxID=2974027 RepID=UPI00216AEAEF|nr:aldo/keto reductase [Corynebacterium sp. HS2168-gen11]MCS4536446.1 aldo/keto reductase [Corynebacterium sp. HS2168-gen11]